MKRGGDGKKSMRKLQKDDDNNNQRVLKIFDVVNFIITDRDMAAPIYRS